MIRIFKINRIHGSGSLKVSGSTDPDSRGKCQPKPNKKMLLYKQETNKRFIKVSNSLNGSLPWSIKTSNFFFFQKSVNLQEMFWTYSGSGFETKLNGSWALRKKGAEPIFYTTLNSWLYLDSCTLPRVDKVCFRLNVNIS